MKRWHVLIALVVLTGNVCSATNVPLCITWSEDPRTTATFAWERTAPGRGTVEYGLTTNYSHCVSGPDGYHRHAITIRDLTPGQTYHYRARSTDGFITSNRTFRTAPGPTGSYHAVYYSDTQQPASGHQGVVDQVLVEDPDFRFTGGDHVADGDVLGEYVAWFGRESNLCARTVFMPTFGNHDAGGMDASRYWRLFEIPKRPLREQFFSYNVGNTHYVSLNSQLSIEGQTNWIMQDLQDAANDSNVTWMIVYFHRPPYTAGDKHPPNMVIRTNWCRLFSMYGVDFVFTGHNHDYERSYPIDGVRYIVSGGGGGPLNDVTPKPYTEKYTSCYHFVSLQVDGDEMIYRAIRSDGLVFDNVTFTNEGRAVRFSPSFPLRDDTVRIMYDEGGGPISGSDPVYVHVGIDDWSNIVDTAMTSNAVTGLWEYDYAIPTDAQHRVVCCFHNAASNTWDNNYTYNWQALLGRVEFDPASPVAGSNVTVRYDASLGPLAGSSCVQMRMGYDGWKRPQFPDVPMTNNPAENSWDCTIAVPGHASQIDLAFFNGSDWDNNEGGDWSVATRGATSAPPFVARPMLIPGSPVITSNPPVSQDENNVGDNFDFDTAGSPFRGEDVSEGFGDFGRIYLNYDDTNLYIGAEGVRLGGTNNVLVIFLGLDTLADDAWNLWHKSGKPNTLDYMHNVGFLEPMDVAIIIGHESGDGPKYPDFTYGEYNFGQGIWYLHTNVSSFIAMTNARLSQFDGSNTTACASADDDGNWQTDRWEAWLPWIDLGAGDGIDSVTNIFLAGVIASDSVTGDDRYISSVFAARDAAGKKTAERRFGEGFVTLLPAKVLLASGDYDGDGLPNLWEHEHFGSAEGPGADDDNDNDSFSNWGEYVADTQPTNAESVFTADVEMGDTDAFVISWPGASNRTYDLYRSTNNVTDFQPRAADLSVNTYTDTVAGIHGACYKVEVKK